MREILFRGKRTDTGEWVYGYLVKRPSAIQIGDCSPWYIEVPPADPDDNGGFYNVDPDTVGQYTGLTDKKGVKIFEGDIVRISLPLPSQDPILGLSSVDFDNGCFMVTWGGSRAIFDSFVGDTTFEVIGNVHDNPEILEVKK